jgi:hypothetical protein
VLLAGLAGCGDDAPPQACGPIVREPADPRSSVHVLPGTEPITYASNPPTSGPHERSEVSGAVHEPLSPPVQVGLLEHGVVLIQWRDLEGEDRDALEAMAGGDVVVAPNPGLDSTVVATAWTAKRTCDAVDVDALNEFIAERRGKGPEE